MSRRADLRFEDQQLTSFAGLIAFQPLLARLDLKNPLRGCFQHLRVRPIFGHASILLQWHDPVGAVTVLQHQAGKERAAAGNCKGTELESHDLTPPCRGDDYDVKHLRATNTREGAMAHIVIEYSANLRGQLDLPGFLRSVHAAALATGVFPIGGRLGILPANEHRLPMVPATPELERKLDAVLKRVGLLEDRAA